LGVRDLEWVVLISLRKEVNMIISIDWVIVCDLVSLIGGIAMGVSLIKPRYYSGRSNRL